MEVSHSLIAKMLVLAPTASSCCLQNQVQMGVKWKLIYNFNWEVANLNSLNLHLFLVIKRGYLRLIKGLTSVQEKQLIGNLNLLTNWAIWKSWVTQHTYPKRSLAEYRSQPLVGYHQKFQILRSGSLQPGGIHPETTLTKQNIDWTKC